jgi:hypothetical protein
MHVPSTRPCETGEGIYLCRKRQLSHLAGTKQYSQILDVPLWYGQCV